VNAAQKPNFFIIGAPKCGTTALAFWLSRHPNVFMSPVKEPHFFNSDQRYILTPDIEDYAKLFEGASEDHFVRGEASVWYLLSKEAIPRIEEFVEGPKYIVCLRNPVEMAYSLHEQLVVSGDENILDFGAAWSMSEDRSAGASVSMWCREPNFLAYKSSCRLGEQLERLYSQVERDRVHLVLMDDLKKNAKTVYEDALSFLGLPSDGRTDFDVINPAKELKSRTVLRFVGMMGKIRNKLGIKRSFGVLNKIRDNNIAFRNRTPLSEQKRSELKRYFTDDIKLLESLARRDLKHWYLD
jgi:Sulfotransferase domain